MANDDKNIPKSRPRPSQAEGDSPDNKERENLRGGELNKNEKPPRPSQAEGEEKSGRK